MRGQQPRHENVYRIQHRQIQVKLIRILILKFTQLRSVKHKQVISCISNVIHKVVFVNKLALLITLYIIRSGTGFVVRK